MPSTIGHALSGVACLLAGLRHGGNRARFGLNWRQVAGFALIANIPDVDFLLGYLIAGNFHLFHGGFTHSLSFVVVCSLLISIVWKRRHWWRTWPLIALAMALHLVMDMLCGPMLGNSLSYGVPLLWPIIDERIRMPFSVFLGIEHATQEALFGLHNVLAMAIEVALFVPLIYVLWRLLKGKAKTTND